MQCCATVRATFRKQQTQNGGEEGGVWILLFSEVTLFEYIVSKIPSLIVSLVIDLSFLDDHDMGEL